ncbi:hypothetical protein [Actinosynnema sp. NPDC023587]|uniref:hypothetical protein n=1 Tax=Actinosynnema sp. NPDC023587 TaxID=3154695 RepID=UPI0033D451F7
MTVEARWDQEHRLVGYRVAMASDWSTTSPDGRVWFSGSSLAHDLSGPQIAARWPSTQPTDDSHTDTELLADATSAADDALRQLATLNAAEAVSPGDGDDIAHAAVDMLLAVSRTIGDPGPSVLKEAAAAYEPAAGAPRKHHPAQWSVVALELRAAARQVLKAGVMSKRVSTGSAALALVLVLVALLTEIAAWRERSRQHAQAVATRQAAGLMTSHAEAMPAP